MSRPSFPASDGTGGSRRLPRWFRSRRGLATAIASLVVVAGVSLAVTDPFGSSAPSSTGVTDNSYSTSTTTSASALTGSSSPPGNLTAQALEFAQCMRAHGVGDYPDPRAPASLPPAPTKIGMTYLGDSFNPDTPTFQAAERACQKYAVGLATKIPPGVAAEVAAEQLKYAQCMQTHRVLDFPDPSANGGFTIPNSVDQNSSFFQAAERACKNFLPGLSGPPGS